jgi:hypothetical protein
LPFGLKPDLTTVAAGCQFAICNSLINRKTEFASLEGRVRLIDPVRRCVVTVLAHAKAEHLGRPLPRTSVRDARSRWARHQERCWRLILAPTAVLDYVEPSHASPPPLIPLVKDAVRELALKRS